MINLSDLGSNRYSRLELISWWDQKILSESRILVAGCGALGNEIIKNLAMLGAGNIFAVDMDKVERSNLTRSVLFREEDEGKPKAETACKRAREINPSVKTYFYNGNIFDLGLGVFRDMDLVICGLDNRESRLFVNQSCWKVNMPMVDGAIEVLNGIARMFMPPDGACYECTLNELDYKLLNKRKSCMLMGIEDIEQGKAPTTPTISSLIASVQVQEAVKYLHNKYVTADFELLGGKGFVYNGIGNESYTVQYQRREDCQSHWTFENILTSEKKFESVSLADAFDEAANYLNSRDLTIFFNNELVYGLENKEGEITPFFSNLNTMKHGDVYLNGDLAKVKSVNSLKTTSDIWDKLSPMKLGSLNLPVNDIITFNAFDKSVSIEFKSKDVFRKG